eukprot:CAMPEP_0184303046 /NCGR_PEP_ID=MMETSP1049-20130417/12865_1 /TAXON_ID=77928 /ORGANISM="Proteomonas sulcata, Strain CCMP704" /LENGTH=69 /DNA_ID=CAMNT_0026614465 /DNA_START=307 /DNA_END=516 /DNA_ORIENTATION=-
MNVKLLLGSNYHRLDPELPWRITIEDKNAIKELVQVAMDANLDDTVDYLRDRWSSSDPPPLDSEESGRR